MVVDRLSKYSHFMALSHPFSALQVAQCYLDNVYKLHGFPKAVISDRDKVFISKFWTKFLTLQGITQKLSTAYHPQTDGQSEVVNRYVETYLRCMCHERLQDWSKWLTLAEYWYNTSFQFSIQKTFFEVLYNQPPPVHRPYILGSSNIDAIDKSMLIRDKVLEELKYNLHRAQNRMKQLVDRKRSERSFGVGDWVYLKLQPYRQMSVVNRSL